MTPPAAQAGLGLLSASSWGGSDFVGGLGARRAPALLVTAAGQAVSLVALVVICFALHTGLPVRSDLAVTLIGGFEGAVSLAIFYRALSLGAMGLTAAVTGLLTAILPVLYSAIRYGLPSPITAAGLLLGCVAIWLITHQAGPAAPVRALVLGATAGIGFGVQLILFKMAASSGILPVMAVARAAGVAGLVVVLLVARPAAKGGGFWLAGSVSGLLDTVGNLFYLAASRVGRLDSAAVVCSLYPAMTILLAAIILRERPSKRQIAGLGLALSAVVLLSS